jgi:hypothetical protein
MLHVLIRYLNRGFTLDCSPEVGTPLTVILRFSVSFYRTAGSPFHIISAVASGFAADNSLIAKSGGVGRGRLYVVQTIRRLKSTVVHWYAVLVNGYAKTDTLKRI